MDAASLQSPSLQTSLAGEGYKDYEFDEDDLDIDYDMLHIRVRDSHLYTCLITAIAFIFYGYTLVVILLFSLFGWSLKGYLTVICAIIVIIIMQFKCLCI